MKLNEIITQVNTLIDDELPQNFIVGWVNDAIAEIGNAVHATFPELKLENPEETPVIPNKWQRILILPYASAKAKQQDSSQFEYEDLFSQFYARLDEFTSEYIVPVQFKELNPGTELTKADGTTYITVSGDTLYQLALEFGETFQELNDRNKDVISFKGSGVQPDFTNAYFSGGW